YAAIRSPTAPDMHQRSHTRHYDEHRARMPDPCFISWRISVVVRAVAPAEIARVARCQRHLHSRHRRVVPYGTTPVAPPHCFQLATDRGPRTAPACLVLRDA